MGRYVSYPTGTAFGALQAQCSEPVGAGGTITIRVRNNTGKLITFIAAQGFCTQSRDAGGTQLDIQNVATTSFLTGVINMRTANQVNTQTIGATTTLASGADAYFIFANAGGGNTMLDAQATIFYTCEFAST